MYSHYGCESMHIIISCVMFAMVISAQWITIYDPPLPTADANMILASYNGSIFITGGLFSAEYVISDNSMFDLGTTQLSTWTPCVGQCDTQFGNVLRVLPLGSNNEIFVYNLEENDFLNNHHIITIPEDAYVTFISGYCLTSNAEYLFITGGYNAATAVKVLLLDNNTWFNGTSMLRERSDHCCIVVSNFVYVIGGYYEDSVNKIAINNIDTGSWIHVGSLSDTLTRIGCVLYDSLIWIIGGVTPLDIPKDTVHTVDVITDAVILRQETLSYAVFAAAVTVNDGVLYAFGGATNTSVTNLWMEYDIMSDASVPPTQTPTRNALTTSIPTTSPTDHPSVQPTSNPTRSPTVNPSAIPTTTPSDHPSTMPTTAPSDYPSTMPTTAPQDHPSETQTETTLLPSPFPDAIVPTTRDGRVMEISTTAHVGDNDNDKVTPDGRSDRIIVAISVAVFVTGAVICCYFGFRFIEQREIKKNATDPGTGTIEMNRVQSVSIPAVHLNDQTVRCADIVDILDIEEKDEEKSEESNDDTSHESLYAYDHDNNAMDTTPGDPNDGGVTKNEGDMTTNGYLNDGDTNMTLGNGDEGETCTVEGDDEVRDWLESKVEMVQYYKCFVNRGLSSLQAIKENITDISDLKDIGIDNGGHQIIIMHHIKQWS